ncbi:hypothetical protein [Thermomonas aquatica]|nr:hypothetical protein [Thermomonas aquatica]
MFKMIGAFVVYGLALLGAIECLKNLDELISAAQRKETGAKGL